PALDCGGHALIAEIDALLQTMPPYSPARDAFATALLGMSEILRLDAEGRVFFEERLKSALGLDGEAVFVGQGHKFQIWEPARFQAHLEQARARVRRLRAEPPRPRSGTFRSRFRRRWTCSNPAPAASMSTRRLAPAAMRARFSIVAR